MGVKPVVAGLAFGALVGVTMGALQFMMSHKRELARNYPHG